ncbi:MAG: Mu transposase C-terminal domain-containing protein, partial [Deltaproteobacteria bacterium]|nr:Mu transposase C-terminal domain-containing protein [Deltaproteobacteria bacterium]
YKKSGLKGLLNGYGKVFRYVDWPDDAKAWLWQKYNTPQSPSASWCIRDLGYKASAEGWPLPSDRTMRRFLESIPLEIKEFYRKGEKHWKQKFLPCILRDDSAKPGEVFISDHAQINIGVRHPSGKVIFPWITCWMDMRTRKILGWCLAEKGKCVPSSETINISLKYTIEKYGIPKHVLIDNGRDFSCYHFTGGQKEKRFRFSLSVNEIEVAGIYKLLGIEAHFCIPANAQAKPIERWFWTNETNFQVEFETYRGNNILNRPEGVDSRIKSGKSVPEWGEFKKFLGNYIEIYNQDHKHSGFGMGGRSPNEIWNKYFADAAHEMRKASPSSLRLLMMPSSRPCKVGRNGITAFDNFYISNDLLKFIGKKVLYRYDPEDFDEIYVYDLENRFLCLAKKRIRTAWNDKEAFKRNKELEKTRKRGIREANEAQKEIIEAKKGYKERKPSGKNPDKPPKVVKMFPTPFEGVQEKIDRKKSRGQTDEQKAIRRAISESSSRMTEEDIKNMEEEEERQAIRDKLKKEFF